MVYIEEVESRFARNCVGARHGLMLLDRRVLLSSRDSVSGHLVNSILMCFCPGVQFSNGCELYEASTRINADISPYSRRGFACLLASIGVPMCFYTRYTRDRVSSLVASVCTYLHSRSSSNTLSTKILGKYTWDQQIRVNISIISISRFSKSVIQILKISQNKQFFWKSCRQH